MRVTINGKATENREPPRRQLVQHVLLGDNVDYNQNSTKSTHLKPHYFEKKIKISNL